jgi:hypothetical protein
MGSAEVEEDPIRLFVPLELSNRSGPAPRHCVQSQSVKYWYGCKKLTRPLDMRSGEVSWIRVVAILA